MTTQYYLKIQTEAIYDLCTQTTHLLLKIIKNSSDRDHLFSSNEKRTTKSFFSDIAKRKNQTDENAIGFYCEHRRRRRPTQSNWNKNLNYIRCTTE